MKLAADSSVLVSLYVDAEAAESIERFLTEDAKVVSLCELARIEVLNVLLRQPDLGAAARFEEDLAGGARLRLESLDWADVFQHAESMARRFARTLRPGGLDLVLVAAAVAMGASWFLSFDRHSRQRPLAGAAGLRVWPPLSKDEKGIARHAAGRLGEQRAASG